MGPKRASLGRRVSSVPRADGADAGQTAASFRIEDTRASYDRVAARYAQEIASELERKPFDRAFLDAFGEAVRPLGRVAELGSGPGHVADYLSGRGVTMVALDLSEGMLLEARRLFPQVEAVQGDMLDLPFGDASLGGIVAFYSIIHFHDGQLALAFSEMARTLVHGGRVALAFHAGDQVVHRDEWWGAPISLDARFLATAHVTALLRDAGLEVTASTEREPYAPEVEYQSRRAYLVARLP
jgi:SAM-dependent methyltransferase